MAPEKRLNSVKVSYWISPSLNEKIEKYCTEHDNMKKTNLVITAITEYLNKKDDAEARRLDALNWEKERSELVDHEKMLVGKINEYFTKLGDQKTVEAKKPGLKNQVLKLVEKTSLDEKTLVDDKEITAILGEDYDLILDVLRELKNDRLVKINTNGKVEIL